MNDFTKDELEKIAYYVYISGDLIHVSRHDILLKKLHSMIDNYCEHEADEFENLDFCKKCDARFR